MKGEQRRDSDQSTTATSKATSQELQQLKSLCVAACHHERAACRRRPLVRVLTVSHAALAIISNDRPCSILLLLTILERTLQSSGIPVQVYTGLYIFTSLILSVDGYSMRPNMMRACIISLETLFR
jgi:hypothetical protein